MKGKSNRDISKSVVMICLCQTKYDTIEGIECSVKYYLYCLWKSPSSHSQSRINYHETEGAQAFVPCFPEDTRYINSS